MKKKWVLTGLAWSLGALFILGVILAGARSQWFGLAALKELDARPMEAYSGYRYGYRWDPYGAPVKGVEIHWINGSVEIRASNSSKLRITEKSDGRELAEGEKLKLSSSGGVVRIDWNRQFIRLAVLENMRKDLVVEIPREVLDAGMELLYCSNTSGNVTLGEGLSAQKLQLMSASGSLQVEQGFAGETADLSTTSGEIMLKNAQLTESLKVRSLKGAIQIDQAASEEVALKNTLGATAFSGQAAQLKGEFVSGSAQVALSAPPEQADLRSVAGHIALDLPAGTGYTLAFETVSGHLQAPSTLSPGAARETYVSGDGKAQLKVVTTGGDLTVGPSSAAG